ncbi:MAG: hypothetical protein AAFX00_12935, partial [Pseudomonadota bacterium]
MVLEKMPGFELTAEILGREVVASDGFALTYISRDGLLGPEAVRTDFLEGFNGRGLPAFNLYYQTTGPEPGRKYWRTEFPGCVPGDCTSLLDASLTSEVTADEHEQFRGYPWAHLYPEGYKLIADKEIWGLLYQARLGVNFDHTGKVMNYFV